MQITTPRHIIADAAGSTSSARDRVETQKRLSLDPTQIRRQVRRKRAFQRFRKKSTTEDNMEEEDVWRPKRSGLSFNNEKFEHEYQMSRNDLVVLECERGMIIVLIFHSIVGTADIIISISASASVNNYIGLMKALLLCGCIIFVCIVQLCIVRAWAGKSVGWMQFPNVVAASKTKEGRLKYQLIVASCLVLRLILNLIVLASAPGFNFSARMLIILAWMCLTTNLSGLWWLTSLFTVLIGFIGFEVALVYLWQECDTTSDPLSSSVVLGFLTTLTLLVALGNAELSYASEILSRRAFLHRESLRQSLYLFEYVVYSNLPAHVVNELQNREEEKEQQQEVQDSERIQAIAGLSAGDVELGGGVVTIPTTIPRTKMSRAILDQYEDVSIGFIYICDLDGFLKGTADDITTTETLQLLNQIWTRLDEMTTKLDVWKVEHVLSEYLIAGGCPVWEPNHETLDCPLFLSGSCLGAPPKSVRLNYGCP